MRLTKHTCFLNSHLSELDISKLTSRVYVSLDSREQNLRTKKVTIRATQYGKYINKCFYIVLNRE